MNESEITGEDQLIRGLDEAVGTCNTPEGVMKIMTIEQEMEIIAQRSRAEGREEGLAEKEREDVLSAIHEGLSKEVIIKIFKISEEQYDKYLQML